MLLIYPLFIAALWPVFPVFLLWTQELHCVCFLVKSSRHICLLLTLKTTLLLFCNLLCVLSGRMLSFCSRTLSSTVCLDYADGCVLVELRVLVLCHFTMKFLAIFLIVLDCFQCFVINHAIVYKATYLCPPSRKYMEYYSFKFVD